LAPALGHAAETRKRFSNRTNKDFKHLRSNFEKSCGMKLSTFDRHLKEVETQFKIPKEVFYSMMLQETGGRCDKTGPAGEIGLFQRLTGGSRDPVKSLRLAAKDLRDKLEILSQKNIRAKDGSTYKGFAVESIFRKNGMPTEFGMRLAISAYNSNELWALRAKSDLNKFNGKHGTKLSAYNWEDLRVFYLRRALTEKDRKRLMDDGPTGRAVGTVDNPKGSLINLGYMENVIPRQTERKQTIFKTVACWKNPTLTLCK
ncbi:MAG TPA: hypothetical protein VM432_05165, partial [Bdellovibrionales bacterium]|nr:hypothetical protein [Bdellovibrionales bacterium]